MSFFSINDGCIQCGLCSKLCLAGIIQIADDESPYVPDAVEANCIKCGQCVVFCPTSSCRLVFHEERIAVDNDKMPDTDVAETLLRSRRSIRSYKDEPADEATVRRILETARYSPTASNSQRVRWIVSMGRARTYEIAQMVADSVKRRHKARQLDAGVAALIAKWDKGIDVIFRGAPQLAVAVIDKAHIFPEDAALALTYFELAAHGLGVGCCWAGFFTREARLDMNIQKSLGVNENEFIVGAQMFGYPAIGRSHILPPRKNVNVTWI